MIEIGEYVIMLDDPRVIAALVGAAIVLMVIIMLIVMLRGAEPACRQHPVGQRSTGNRAIACGANDGSAPCRGERAGGGTACG